MRKLIITRGLPGSGKSTTISNLGLDEYTVSSDKARLLLSSLCLNTDGNITISQLDNDYVWKQIREILKHRLSTGITTVIDAVHAKLGSMSDYIKLANFYGYEVACLNFMDTPIELVKERNAHRSNIAFVNDKYIDKFYEDYKKSNSISSLSKKIKVINVYNNQNYKNEVMDFLKPKIIDLSMYNSVVHIGDIQGCFQPLKELFKNGMDNNKFYIFTGDFCDRGEENGKVVRFLVDNFSNRKNVAKLIGNHEYHLFRELHDLKHKSDEFKLYTKKHLLDNNITKDDLNLLLNGMVDCFIYNFNDKKVIVSHGGVSSDDVDNFWKIPSIQFEKGVGGYDIDIDKVFNENRKEFYQVHGHRNKNLINTICDYSINLEGHVDSGGNLRTVTLTKDGFCVNNYANNLVRPWRNRLMKVNNIVPVWMKKETNTQMSDDVFNKLNNHTGVIIRETKKDKNILSINFSRDVFYDKSWDDVVVKARGLFINKATKEIVARSYDKFFNIGENKDMELDVVANKISYPVIGRNKENGFLGIVGYNSADDSLFISTKGSPTGDFADLFRDIFYKTFEENIIFKIKSILRDFECSLIFEVIEPNLDPHMVEYDDVKLILLDMVHRSMDYSKLDYNQLLKVGKILGVEVAEKKVVLKDKKSFIGYCNSILNDSDFKFKNEGLVFMDSNNYMFKIKTPFYSLWKILRSSKDYLFKQKSELLTIINPNNINKAVNSINKIQSLSPDFKNKVIAMLGSENITKNDILEFMKLYKDSDTTNLFKVSSILNKLINLKQNLFSNSKATSLNNTLRSRKMDFTCKLASDFIKWCDLQSVDTLSKDIISLRKMFLAQIK